jgi:hypothetical protein
MVTGIISSPTMAYTDCGNRSDTKEKRWEHTETCSVCEDVLMQSRELRGEDPGGEESRVHGHVHAGS